MNEHVLKKLNQRPIAYYPLYKDMTSSTIAGVVLSQLMYWFSKKDKFYKTDDDILKETHLSKNELRTAKKIIKKLSFIAVTREGVPAKTYYKIDWKLYEFSLVDFTKLDELNPHNSTSDIHETITKTTTKNERESFFSINKNSINIYIKHIIAIDNIRNKTAFKRTMIEKFMGEDKSTIQVFEDWKIQENIKKILTSSKNFIFTILNNDSKEDYILQDVKKEAFEIVLIFKGINNEKKGLFYLRKPLDDISEAVRFLNSNINYNTTKKVI